MTIRPATALVNDNRCRAPATPRPPGADPRRRPRRQPRPLERSLGRPPHRAHSRAPLRPLARSPQRLLSNSPLPPLARQLNHPVVLFRFLAGACHCTLPRFKKREPSFDRGHRRGRRSLRNYRPSNGRRFVSLRPNHWSSVFPLPRARHPSARALGFLPPARSASARLLPRTDEPYRSRESPNKPALAALAPQTPRRVGEPPGA
jgi:hypothetical protein